MSATAATSSTTPPKTASLLQHDHQPPTSTNAEIVYRPIQVNSTSSTTTTMNNNAPSGLSAIDDSNSNAALAAQDAIPVAVPVQVQVVPPRLASPPVGVDVLQGKPQFWVDGNRDAMVAEMQRNHSLMSTLGICGIQAGHGDISGTLVVPKTFAPMIICHGLDIDLSQAVFVHPVTTISVFVICGGVRVIVPRGVRVESFGVAICGGMEGLDETGRQLNLTGLDSPLVKVTGLTICGGVNVELNVTVDPVAHVRYASPPTGVSPV